MVNNLKSSRLNKAMLAGKIEKLYCSNIIAIPRSPSSQSSDVDSYCSSSESDSSSMVYLHLHHVNLLSTLIPLYLQC